MDPIGSAALLGSHDQVHPQMVDGDLQYDDVCDDESNGESGDDDSGKDDDEDSDDESDDDIDEADRILDQGEDEEIQGEENDNDNDFHYEQLDLTKQQIRLVAISRLRRPATESNATGMSSMQILLHIMSLYHTHGAHHHQRRPFWSTENILQYDKICTTSFSHSGTISAMFTTSGLTSFASRRRTPEKETIRFE
jgi:hypothetical protein